MRPALFAAVPLLVAAAAASAATPAPRDPADVNKYRACLELAETDPVKAMDFAGRWRGQGGGIPARHCLALAQMGREDYAAAQLTLEGAARAAEAIRDPLVPELWGQAGNAALMAGRPQAAVDDLSAALAAATGVAPWRRAELLIDRARAAVEAGDPATARKDLAQAVKLDAANVDGWLLIATMARADNRLELAEQAIVRASKLAPGDPDIALEAGNIALAQGRPDLARQAWSKVVEGAPDSAAGRAAAKSLAKLRS